MKNGIAVLGIVLLFPVLLMLSCTSAEKKTASNQSEATDNVHQVDTVVISMMKFNPEQVQAAIGDTIVWINKDLVEHTVKSYQDNKFYSDTLPPGQAWKWVIMDTAAYYCTLHPATMKGNIAFK